MQDLKPQNLLLSSSSPDAILKVSRRSSSSISSISTSVNGVALLLTDLFSFCFVFLFQIADFGFARYMEPNNLAATLCGSPLYMAPEILGSREYDATVDLWSIGGILYEMVIGKPPYTGQNHIQLLHRIQTTEVKFPTNVQLSPPLIDLLTHLLQRNPRDRITFQQFFQHPFVQESMKIAQELVKRVEQQQQQQQQQSKVDPIDSANMSTVSPHPTAPPTPSSFTPQPALMMPPLNSLLQSPILGPAMTPPTTSPTIGATNSPHSSATNSPSTLQSILKSLQPPTLPSTPPNHVREMTVANIGRTPPQSQSSTPTNTNTSLNHTSLYGSSPSQQQQQQQQQPQLSQFPPQYPSNFTSPQTIPVGSNRYSPISVAPLPNYSPNSQYNQQYQQSQQLQQQQQQQQQQPSSAYGKPIQQVGFIPPSPSGQQLPSFSPPSPSPLNLPQSQAQSPSQAQPFSHPSPVSSRPISRHDTPQYLRTDGSTTSIDREYVLIDGDANAQSQSQSHSQNGSGGVGVGGKVSNSSTGVTGTMHPPPPLRASPSPHSNMSIPTFLASAEASRQRMQRLFKRAQEFTKTADSKLQVIIEGIVGETSQSVFHATSTDAVDEIHHLLATLLDELSLSSNVAATAVHESAVAHMSALGGVGIGSAGAVPSMSVMSTAQGATMSPQQQLVVPLSLYMNSFEQLEAVIDELQRTLVLIDEMVASLSSSSSPSPSNSSSDSTTISTQMSELIKIKIDLSEVLDHFQSTADGVWEKCWKVRKTMEEVTRIGEQIQHNGRVKLAPPTTHSRRPSLTSNDEKHDSSEIESLKSSSIVPSSSTLSASPSTSSLVSFLTTPVSFVCGEKLLFDDCLIFALAGIHAEHVQDYETARGEYTKSKKKLDALLSDEMLTDGDRVKLNRMSDALQMRMNGIKKKPHQQSHPQSLMHPTANVYLAAESDLDSDVAHDQFNSNRGDIPHITPHPTLINNNTLEVN